MVKRPRETNGHQLSPQLTITIELDENFLHQVVAIGGIECWNNLQHRLAPVVGQVWSSDEDAPAIGVFFAMPMAVKEQYPDADFRHVFFTDEVQEKPNLPVHMTITAIPTRAIPADGALAELFLNPPKNCLNLPE